MSRYFFHTPVHHDDVGVEIDSDIDAHRQCIQTLGQMLLDDPDRFWATKPWYVEVTDDANTVMWELQVHGLPGAAGKDRGLDR